MDFLASSSKFVFFEPDVTHEVKELYFYLKESSTERVAVISAENHKRKRRKRQSVTAKREKSQTPKVLTAILTLSNLT